MPDIKLMFGDCLERMKEIPDYSIDMILCDLPYGKIGCKWDTIIPFPKLWKHYKRIIKPGGVIALFGTEPFSSYLRLSNIKEFKYDWIWNKPRGSGFQVSKYRPLISTEIISIFCKGTAHYFPQMRDRDKPRVSSNKGTTRQMLISNGKPYMAKEALDKRYPITSLYFSNEINRDKKHPTQKPVALLEYLIKTYTKEGETVLDNTMGSGSTGVACMNTNRNFIGIEKEEKYFSIAKQRLEV